MKMKNTTKSTLSLAAAVAAAFTLAPTAQADVVFLTDSDQLNLTDRDVLAAVNFMAPPRTRRGGYGRLAGSRSGTTAYPSFRSNAVPSTNRMGSMRTL